MPITTSVPSSIDTPNTFHEFHYVKAGGSPVAVPARVLLVGVKTSGGAASTEVPVRIFDTADAITKFGKGSELALMAAKAFEQGNINQAYGYGGMPELWGCSIAPPTGVAASSTLTVTVTTATAGTVVFRIAGRTLFAGVSAGDSVTAIATAISTAINAASRELPVTATSSAGVVTIPHNTTGTNGNDVSYEIVSTPSGVSVAWARPTDGTGTVSIANSLDAAVDRNYDAVAISIHSSTAITNSATHLTAMWGFAQKYFRWVFLGDRASQATTQAYATAADSDKIVVVTCENTPSLPSEIAAAAAVLAFGAERPNMNFDNARIALYPPLATYAYTASEIESAIDGGMTPLRPTPDGTALEVVKLVTTKVTDNSVPFLAAADLAISRTLAYRATQYDIQYRLRFRQEVIDGDLNDPNATLLARIRDMCVEIDREMGRLGYLRNVEDYVSQIRVEEASSPMGRVLVQAPCRVANPLHQVAFDHLSYYL